MTMFYKVESYYKQLHSEEKVNSCQSFSLFFVQHQHIFRLSSRRNHHASGWQRPDHRRILVYLRRHRHRRLLRQPCRLPHLAHNRALYRLIGRAGESKSQPGRGVGTHSRQHDRKILEREGVVRKWRHKNTKNNQMLVPRKISGYIVIPNLTSPI